MDGGPVVPHNEITDLPFVHVDAFTLGGVLEQIGKKQPRLGRAQADDLPRVHANEEDFTARAGMGVNDGPHRRRHRVLLLVGIGIIAKQNARMQREVLGGKIGDHCARPGIERVVRSAQIGEFGIAAPARRDQCMQHRICGARAHERAVAMPQLVGEIGQVLRRGALLNLAVHADVGNVDQALVF